LIKGPSFLDLREAWPSSGHPPPEQPNMRMKKEEMVLQLVFRVPAETLHATTAPVCPPPFSHSPNPRRVCVARPPDGCTNVVGLFFRASTLHSFVSWEARLQRAQRGDSSRSRGRGGWFVVSDEHLITGEYLQSLAHGRSSNDEAQAWGCGWTKVGRFECVPSSAAVRKEGLKLSCAHRKRRTEYQARDAARGQSQ
jgi:hypothetical protein